MFYPTRRSSRSCHCCGLAAQGCFLFPFLPARPPARGVGMQAAKPLQHCGAPKSQGPATPRPPRPAAATTSAGPAAQSRRVLLLLPSCADPPRCPSNSTPSSYLASEASASPEPAPQPQRFARRHAGPAGGATVIPARPTTPPRDGAESLRLVGSRHASGGHPSCAAADLRAGRVSGSRGSASGVRVAPVPASWGVALVGGEGRGCVCRVGVGQVFFNPRLLFRHLNRPPGAPRPRLWLASTSTSTPHSFPLASCLPSPPTSPPSPSVSVLSGRLRLACSLPPAERS